MTSYSKTAKERATKIRGVILRALAKKIAWWQAAEILGFSDRHFRRICEQDEQFGCESLCDKRRGKPSPQASALRYGGEVLAQYREKYFDLNSALFCRTHREQGRDQLTPARAECVLRDFVHISLEEFPRSCGHATTVFW